MAKRSLCMLLAVAAVFSLAAPAFAAEGEPAEAPAVTEIPIEGPEVSVDVQDVSVDSPDVSAEDTEVPAVTEIPVEATEIPVEATEVPVEATEVPVEATEAPVEATEAPVEVTEAPVEVTEVPVETTEVPVEVTEVPVETEAPVEVTEVPVVEPEATEAPEETVTEDEAMAASDIVTSGSCGENVTYTLTSDGTMTISGKGDMEDYYEGGPWYNGYDNDYYARRIKKVVIESGITHIGSWAFWQCRDLASVSIPNTVTSIGGYAFYHTALKTVNVPSSVKTIGSYAFGECLDLTSVTLGYGVETIELYAFSSPNLASINIPGSVNFIGDWAFSGTSLTSVVLPSSVTEIGRDAFSTSKLQDITIYNSQCDIHGVGIAGRTLGNPDIVVIHGHHGSTVEELAKQYGYKFEEIQDLETPQITNVSYASGSVKISWLPVSGAVNYRVYYRTGSSDVWHALGETTETSYAWKGAKAGTEYWFTLLCVSIDSTDSLSAYDTTGYSFVIPGSSMLATPVVKIAVVGSGIQATWKAVPGAERYMVYYKENGGSWQKIGTTTKTSYTRDASKLKGDTFYNFTVRCVKNDKKTMTSSFKASNQLYYHAAPKVKIALTSSGIKVSWNKVKDVPLYMVYYRENGGSWQKIGATNSTSYTRAPSRLKGGTKYQFTVRCVDRDGKTMLSPFTASNSLNFLAAPNVKIAKTLAGITVSWNKVSGAERYMIYYKLNGSPWQKIGTTTKTSYTRLRTQLKNGTYQFTVRCVKNDKVTVQSAFKASNSLQYTK